MERQISPLSRGFNIAVLHIASRLFPRGFDIGADAPHTLDSLWDHYQKTGRILVWNGASGRTIFDDSEVNFAFRAWHDWRHITENAPFTPVGESAVCAAQCEDIRALFGDCESSRKFCAILDAEINGQTAYFSANGYFPENQIAFTRDYLANPDLALSRDYGQSVDGGLAA